MNINLRRPDGTASLNFRECDFEESSSSDSCESPEYSDYDDDDQSLPSGSPPESPIDSDDEMDFPPPSDDESVHKNGSRKHLTVHDANNADTPRDFPAAADEDYKLLSWSRALKVPSVTESDYSDEDTGIPANFPKYYDDEEDNFERLESLCNSSNSNAMGEEAASNSNAADVSESVPSNLHVPETLRPFRQQINRREIESPLEHKSYAMEEPPVMRKVEQKPLKPDRLMNASVPQGKKSHTAAGTLVENRLNPTPPKPSKHVPTDSSRDASSVSVPAVSRSSNAIARPRIPTLPLSTSLPDALPSSPVSPISPTPPLPTFTAMASPRSNFSCLPPPLPSKPPRLPANSISPTSPPRSSSLPPSPRPLPPSCPPPSLASHCQALSPIPPLSAHAAHPFQQRAPPPRSGGETDQRSNHNTAMSHRHTHAVSDTDTSTDDEERCQRQHQNGRHLASLPHDDPRSNRDRTLSTEEFIESEIQSRLSPTAGNNNNDNDDVNPYDIETESDAVGGQDGQRECYTSSYPPSPDYSLPHEEDNPDHYPDIDSNDSYPDINSDRSCPDMYLDDDLGSYPDMECDGSYPDMESNGSYPDLEDALLDEDFFPPHTYRSEETPSYPYSKGVSEVGSVRATMGRIGYDSPQKRHEKDVLLQRLRQRKLQEAQARQMRQLQLLSRRRVLQQQLQRQHSTEGGGGGGKVLNLGSHVPSWRPAKSISSSMYRVNSPARSATTSFPTSMYTQSLTGSVQGVTDRHRHTAPSRRVAHSSMMIPPPPPPLPLSLPPPRPSPGCAPVMRGGYTRQEVVDSKMKKPKYAVSRVRLLCGWLSSLHLWERQIEISTLQQELRSGVFLVRLIRHLDPSAVLSNITHKVHSAKAAIENVEQVLGHVLRSKRINRSLNRIPSGQEVVDGHVMKIISLLFELFQAYVGNIWNARGPRTADMMLWYDTVLTQYSRPIHFQGPQIRSSPSPSSAMRADDTYFNFTGCADDRPIGMKLNNSPSSPSPSPFHSGLRTGQGRTNQNTNNSRIPSCRNSHGKGSGSLYSRFRTGTDMFLTIFHFYGAAELQVGSKILKIDPSKIHFDPVSLACVCSNVTYVFDLLEMLGVDLFWTVEEWIAIDDCTFLLLQLSYLYTLCRTRQCVLPLADTLTATPGITSGPLGVPIVVGLIFADTPCAPPPPPLTQMDSTVAPIPQGVSTSGGLLGERYELFSFSEHHNASTTTPAKSNSDSNGNDNGNGGVCALGASRVLNATPAAATDRDMDRYRYRDRYDNGDRHWDRRRDEDRGRGGGGESGNHAVDESGEIEGGAGNDWKRSRGVGGGLNEDSLAMIRSSPYSLHGHLFTSSGIVGCNPREVKKNNMSNTGSSTIKLIGSGDGFKIIQCNTFGFGFPKGLLSQSSVADVLAARDRMKETKEEKRKNDAEEIEREAEREREEGKEREREREKESKDQENGVMVETNDTDDAPATKISADKARSIGTDRNIHSDESAQKVQGRKRINAAKRPAVCINGAIDSMTNYSDRRGMEAYPEVVGGDNRQDSAKEPMTTLGRTKLHSGKEKERELGRGRSRGRGRGRGEAVGVTEGMSGSHSSTNRQRRDGSSSLLTSPAVPHDRSSLQSAQYGRSHRPHTHTALHCPQSVSMSPLPIDHSHHAADGLIRGDGDKVMESSGGSRAGTCSGTGSRSMHLAQSHSTSPHPTDMIFKDREGPGTNTSDPSTARLSLFLPSVSPHHSQLLRPSTSNSPPPSPPKYAYSAPPSLDDWGDKDTDGEVLSLSMPLTADSRNRLLVVSPPPSPPPLDDLTDLYLQHVHLSSTPHPTPWMGYTASHADQSAVKTRSRSHSSSPSRHAGSYLHHAGTNRTTFSSPPTPLRHDSPFHVSATVHHSPLDISPFSLPLPLRPPTNPSPGIATAAEKGWITHTNKGYTHNAPLNQARAHALAARTGTVVPPKLREDALALLLEEREGKGASIQRPPSAPTHMKHLLPTPRTPSPRKNRNRPKGNTLSNEKKEKSPSPSRVNPGSVEEMRQICREIRENESRVMEHEDMRRQQHYRALERE